MQPRKPAPAPRIALDGTFRSDDFTARYDPPLLRHYKKWWSSHIRN
jgi:hypothetical protein